MRQSAVFFFTLFLGLQSVLYAQVDQRQRDHAELVAKAAEHAILIEELERNQTRILELANSFVDVDPAKLDFVLPGGVKARRVYECCKLKSLLGDIDSSSMRLGLPPTLDGIQFQDLPGREPKGNGGNMTLPPPIQLSNGVLRINGYGEIGRGVFCGGRNGTIEDLEADNELIDAVAALSQRDFLLRQTPEIKIGKYLCKPEALAEVGTVNLLRIAKPGESVDAGDAIYAFEIRRKESFDGFLIVIKELRNGGKFDAPTETDMYNRIFQRGLAEKLTALLAAEGFKNVTFSFDAGSRVTFRGTVEKGRLSRFLKLAARLYEGVRFKSEVVEL